MKFNVCASLVLWAFLSAGLLSAQAEQGKSYPDGHGGKVFFPMGDRSFADEVLSFEKGSPSAAPKDSRSEDALGVPNYDKEADNKYTTLGCGGTLTLGFRDNALVDIEGPDLYVFEIGSALEPTDLSISADGRHWVKVGKIAGGRADVNIHPYVHAGDIFHYVRLTDLKSDCGGEWPGADIDAVGAIGSGIQIALQGAVLFDFNKVVLKNAAKKILQATAKQISAYPHARVVIEGHSDSVGAENYNLNLSEKRASAVKDYLLSLTVLEGKKMESRGWGETRPVASNETDKGRARNRRVEIIVIPSKK